MSGILQMMPGIGGGGVGELSVLYPSSGTYPIPVGAVYATIYLVAGGPSGGGVWQEYVGMSGDDIPQPVYEIRPGYWMGNATVLTTAQIALLSPKSSFTLTLGTGGPSVPFSTVRFAHEFNYGTNTTLVFNDNTTYTAIATSLNPATPLSSNATATAANQALDNTVSSSNSASSLGCSGAGSGGAGVTTVYFGYASGAGARGSCRIVWKG